MKELLDKLTSYNLFNYLLPGIIFVSIEKEFTPYSLIQENIIIGAFIYYFIGLVISRFGSLIIGPLLKKIKFIKFIPYPDFISASKKDSKIEILSETNNMHRTFISMLILLLIVKLYGSFGPIFPREYNSYILIILLLIIFLFSYKKQTQFIIDRIKNSETLSQKRD